jgi:hypothetical protein
VDTGRCEPEDRGRSSGTAAIAFRDVVRDPPFALELEELLPHRLARKLQHASELRDGRHAAVLELRQDRTTAVRELGERNGLLLSIW